MNGIKFFSQFLYENWVTIIVCCGLAICVCCKVRDVLLMSQEEKYEIAKAQIKAIMLSLVTKAELDFESWNKSGSIKRSQVISNIFEQYPILSKFTNQETVIKWIDDEIDNSLKTLRSAIESK